MSSSFGIENLLFHFLFHFWLLFKFYFRNLGVVLFQFAKSYLLVDFSCMVVVCHLLKPHEPPRTCRRGALQRSPQVSQRLSSGHNCHLPFHRCLGSHSEQKHSIFSQNLQLNKNGKKTIPCWRFGFWHSTLCSRFVFSGLCSFLIHACLSLVIWSVNVGFILFVYWWQQIDVIKLALMFCLPHLCYMLAKIMSRIGYGEFSSSYHYPNRCFYEVQAPLLLFGFSKFLLTSYCKPSTLNMRIPDAIVFSIFWIRN